MKVSITNVMRAVELVLAPLEQKPALESQSYFQNGLTVQAFRKVQLSGTDEKPVIKKYIQITIEVIE